MGGRLRLAVMGPGIYWNKAHRPALARRDDVEVVAFCASSDRRRAEVAAAFPGRPFYTDADAFLAEVAEIHRVARFASEPYSGTLRLGAFPTLAPYLLPHVVPGMRRRFPQLELLLVEEKTDRILERLRDGRLDAGVLALPLHDDQLHVEPLFEEPFVLAVPRNHPMADQDGLRLQELDDRHLLLLEEGHCLRDQALSVCQMVGADERAGFRATSLETLRQMVAAGIGVTLLPRLAVSPPVPESPDVALVPIADPAPSRQIAMYWRNTSAYSDFLRQLAEVFRQVTP